jgi:2,3-dihydroxybiphenyl 1,2-dioxygenase
MAGSTRSRAGPIRALGYVGLRSVDPSAWAAFAPEAMGMQATRGRLPDSVWLRVDEHVCRYLIVKGDRPALDVLGFDVGDEAGLAQITRRLEAAGKVVDRPSREHCALRAVDGLIATTDAEGNPVEFFHGLAKADSAFVPGRPIGGFRSGGLGPGHAVLLVHDFAAQSRFYREVLGCGVSDFHAEPFPAEFLHVNARHHTVGLIGTEGAPGVHHLMCEYEHLDDLGRAYDIALRNPESIGVSLGRHLNDHVTSFYLRAPDGFLIELGWAGRLIDPESWVPEELASPSLWGHVRHWLPAERRARAEAMTRAMGDAGVRAPVHVTRSGAFEWPPAG